MRLNVGSGEQKMPGFISVDPFAPADIVAPAHAIPLPDESIDEIHSSYMLQAYNRKTCHLVFAEWFRLLKPGGMVTIIVPDGESAMIEWLRADERDNRIMDVLFGSPDHQPAHACGMAWDVRYLQICLERAGFTGISVKIDSNPAHRNDLCLFAVARRD